MSHLETDLKNSLSANISEQLLLLNTRKGKTVQEEQLNPGAIWDNPKIPFVGGVLVERIGTICSNHRCV
jgi:hypothetical protein